MRSLLAWPWRALRAMASGVLALLILFEEWGWEPLQRAMAWVARLPVLRRIEQLIVRLPPRAALLVFLLPSLLLLPVKLLALWLVAQGQQWLGLGVIVLAKLAGTAVVARLFTLTKPALMRMAWFASVYGRWSRWKEALLAHVRASWAWRWGRAFKRQFKRRWARWRAMFAG
ncbi:MAG: hypothetical protein HY855_10830 [Burkholderiales bacterium]|nr:hypothetical protein [Burkholderiales bacterium]